jgi:xanthine dehydrogenase small subunit
MIAFILNNESVSTSLPAGSTVLDFIRYRKRLTGTKIGCREGDCGACTVLVGSMENDRLVYRSMTSCLLPLANAAGRHVVTVEGINGSALTPVQQALVDTNGTQCGFCTLGFVMSFTGFALEQKAASNEAAIASVDGNICRCTGYKSIERAAALIAGKLSEKPAENVLPWLIDNGFIPASFSDIAERLRALPLPEDEISDGLHIGGGTDLLVQRPEYVHKATLRPTANFITAKGIHEEGDTIRIGGAVTVTELVESPLMRRQFPDLDRQMKLVSSTPIRNMATVAGNLVNASPIGDLTAFFLALDATVTLQGQNSERSVPLRQFYKSYKNTERSGNELLRSISFSLPRQGSVFSFEKVSKRTHLDIASVNSACLARMEADGTIASMHLSAGGVAPIPTYLAATTAFLTGRALSEEVLREALDIANGEIAPISDARGSSDYKRILLRQLLLAHFLKLVGPTEPIVKLLAP